ncbi:serine protease [Lentzea sp. BCCO 10_0061]|uniref:Serine protease n=1 Tax=Lentzea sokolovensis TaxID=3095429 RepID=A0ABU4VD27_9PSEU|nr:serine protease [Lentzea sp. BCCO 10_0061]MDX8148790.1 serine protease [Lentzea sp. BCCO 10_0061]
MTTNTTSGRAERLRQLVCVRSYADSNGIGLESVPMDEVGTGPGAVDVVGRVEAALDEVPSWVDDPQEYRRALKVLLRETEKTALRMDAGAETPDDDADAVVLEAVVRADGTRPSLFVQDDQVDDKLPLVGQWAADLVASRKPLRHVIKAVGRIQPDNATGRNFFGTGWVVDTDKGLVLTNLHVLEAMWKRLGHLMRQTRTGFEVLGGAYIDFAAESGRDRTNRCRIVAATPSGVDGKDFARLDAAVLRIEPENGGKVPAAIPVSGNPDGPQGSLASHCVVGYPGPPPYTSGTTNGVDWAWVNATLFGNRYGVKRLAPGNTHRPLGSFAPKDPEKWVFGHDCTTLGGNSGSPLLAWKESTPAAFGLHFAGATADTNCAHAISACAKQLRALGVPVQ